MIGMGAQNVGIVAMEIYFPKQVILINKFIYYLYIEMCLKENK